jgi:hypothetical protein
MDKKNISEGQIVEYKTKKDTKLRIAKVALKLPSGCMLEGTDFGLILYYKDIISVVHQN